MSRQENTWLSKWTGSSTHVLDTLLDLFVLRGLPDYIRSDNDSEFTAELVRKLLKKLKVKTLFIEPGSPWENGYNESFNGKLRQEFIGFGSSFIKNAINSTHYQPQKRKTLLVP